MTEREMMIATILELSGIILIIYGLIIKDKVKRFGCIVSKIVLVYWSVFKMWKEERQDG